MLKSILFLVACVCIPFVTSLHGLMLGPGRWLVLNIVHCDNPDQYEFIFEISRKKINRTHDCFDIIADLDKEFNFTYATTIDVYQKVDGGFKYFQTISDDSACKFVMKHGEENVKRALTMAKIDPPDCPLKPGLIEIRNFVMDYRELPTQGIYGTFEAYVYALFDERKVGCVKIILNFDKRDDSEDSEEDEDGYRIQVLNTVPCDNPEQYEMPIIVSRKKINRTHDCFDIYMDLKRPADSKFGVQINIYQLVDGGFKYFQTMGDGNACTYLKRRAKENLVRALTMANIVPPDCPILPTTINVTNFVMDYRQLPKHGVYGTFEAVVEFSHKELKLACLKVTVNFDERDENESDEYL